MYEARKVVFDVLHELNRIFEIQRIAIRGLGWEEYVTPGIATESQALINEQLLAEYDILIALFGTKLGTPTANSASGTVEEIEHAIANSRSSLGKSRVQVYFRDRIESVSNISVDEFKKVADFRESLKSRGILYRLFVDDKDLQKEVRVNIERAILEYLKRQDVQSSAALTKLDTEHSDAGDNDTVKSVPEEFGILDHMEKAENALSVSIASAARIGPLVEEIAAETNRQVAVFERSVGLPASEKKSVVNDFASFLKAKAAELKRVASSARENFDTFAEAVVLGAALEKEVLDTERYDKDLAEFLRGAESVLPTFAAARNATISFLAVAQNLPRITIQFNQAKRELLEATTECLNFFDNAERRIFEITAKT
jgi:hypothetical protein